MPRSRAPEWLKRNWPWFTWLAAGLFVVLDVLAVRAAWWEYRGPPEGLARTVFEPAADGPFAARAVAWDYRVVPHPRWLNAGVLLVPPGYPLSLTTRRDDATALRVHVYEDRTPLVVLVRVGSGPWQALLAEGASTRLEPLKEPPAVALFHPLPECFPAGEPQTWTFQHQAELVVDAGRCRWRVDGREVQVVLDSYAASARVEVETPGLRAAPVVDGTWLLWAGLVALVHRLLWRSPRRLGVDAVVTVGTFLASFGTPAFAVVWALKVLAGMGFLAVRAFRAGLFHRGVAVAVGSCAALLLLGVLLVDAHWLAERFALWQPAAGGAPQPFPWRGSLTDRVAPETSHLVLGYSGVNGAGQDAGAQGERALDAVLRHACGGPGESWARHAVDGGNACFLRDSWTGLAARLPRLTRMVFLGGFNDDVTATPWLPGTVLTTLVGMVPGPEPYPAPLAAWEAQARRELEGPRMEELLRCTTAVAAAGRHAPLLHLVDLATLDLGRSRRFGRDAWLAARQKAVEKAGGTLVDLRTLLPGESPVHFNDFIHLSQLGQQQVARALCPLLRPRRNPE